jgi:hypothetical protein
MKGVRARIIADIKAHFTSMKQSLSIHLIKILNEKIVLIMVADYLFTQRKTSAFAGNTNLKMI